MMRTMNPSLRVEQARSVTPTIPANVFHNSYRAVVSTKGLTRWVVDSPGLEMLLDNEAFIVYTVTLSDIGTAGDGLSNMFEGFDFATQASPDDFGASASTPGNSWRMAFRQGFCMLNAMSHCRARINEEQYTSQPAFWNGPVTRFYATPNEVRNVCSMSGGGDLDTGNFSHQTRDDSWFTTSPITTVAIGDRTAYSVGLAYEAPVALDPGQGITSTANIRCLFPRTGWFHNEGLTGRWYRMAHESRLQGSAANAGNLSGSSRYASTITLEVAERVPVQPFLLWERRDGRRRIPFVRRLELDLTWLANYQRLQLQGFVSTTAANELSLDFWSTPPVLHLKWIVPASMKHVPNPSYLPLTWRDTQIIGTSGIFDIAKPDLNSEVREVRCTNVRLRHVPGQLMFYFKQSPNLSPYDWPCEKHLEIIDMRLSYNTAKGTFVKLVSQTMFSTYVNNSPVREDRRFNYDEWKRRHCTVVLHKADHGIQYVEPGGLLMDVTFNVRSHWVLPTVGVESLFRYDQNDVIYNAHMVADYGYALRMGDEVSRIAHLSEFGR